MPLTNHNPEFASLPGDDRDIPLVAKAGIWRPILCTHRAWLDRRTAEFAGKEPVAVSSERTWDGRAEELLMGLLDDAISQAMT